jgi:hypothetical protein
MSATMEDGWPLDALCDDGADSKFSSDGWGYRRRDTDDAVAENEYASDILCSLGTLLSDAECVDVQVLLPLNFSS